ncbi:PRC-barrel domain-containing protein [Mesorhizobium xinjiangense]|uniref:PRC-barrel domain-containing protein n=1 Tax=Mesorhizobium xinjiangense TaxID=2678685 RepID=UPI0012EEDB3F|nr:PRC-barrel domain-containing protein [Mesorhizobium xinjiangense]
MFRKLFAATAVAALMATGAIAQTTYPTPTDPTAQQPIEVPMVVKAKGNLASNIIGKSVLSGPGESAENIGKVSDIVISPEGELQAVVIGVGGFLGIGRKDVAIEYDLVNWLEVEGNRYMIVETNAEALKALPDFDRTAFVPMPADADVSEPVPATAEDISKAEETVAAEKAAAEAEATDPATTGSTTPTDEPAMPAQ